MCGFPVLLFLRKYIVFYSLAAAWASPLLQGRVRGLPGGGRTHGLWRRPARGCAQAQERLYCVGFHMKGERVLGEGCFSSLCLGVRDVMFCFQVCCCQFPYKPGKKRLGRGGTGPLSWEALGGSLPAYPALGDSANLPPWCSLEGACIAPQPLPPQPRPLCLHVGSMGRPACTGGSAPGVTPCGQIASAGPCFHMQPISSSCASCGHSSLSSLSFPVPTNLESEGQ